MNVTNARSATSSVVDGLHALSAPASPLRGPMKTGRRRPNNLTIQTPGFDKTTFSASEILPTPSYRPLLKHHESSPSLPSILSPTTAPLAGMHGPPLSVSRKLSRSGSESSFSSLSLSSQGLHDLREDGAEVNETVTSQEVQERGYPDGPVCIYDAGIYLYLEPSREEASKFGTVINVAKEVANPFSNLASESKDSVVSVWRRSENSDTTEPRTGISDNMSFKSAPEWPQGTGPTSPTTPKAKVPEPEYIHVLWDHNSEILDDLYPLCEMMDSRVSRGKNVLVHCQLGVSRSASLVIAYGLYKGFKTDFHSMYTSVKERSPWVGPNMSLIYQLMDFQSRVANREYVTTSKPSPPARFTNASTEHEMTPRPFRTPQDVAVASRPPSQPTETLETSASARCPTTLTNPQHPVPLSNDARLVARKTSLTTAMSETTLAASPGAKTASPSCPMSRSLGAPPLPPKSAKRNAHRPLPLREPSNPCMQTYKIPSHTARDISHGTTTRQAPSYAPVGMDLMMSELPPSPSIFSPRTTEFRTLSSSGTKAGDLAMRRSKEKPGHRKRLSIFAQAHAPVVKDPRSPHHENGSPGILRRIDDVM